MGVRSDYVTRPREQIASILGARKRFISAADIHRALETAKAKVSLSTVYRTLEHLLTKGDVTVRVDPAGESTYMLCDPDAVDCTAIEQFSESLRSLNGFALEDHAMEFFGRCKACQ